MKIYTDIKQGTEDWHEVRYGKIGSSTLKDIMTKLSDPIQSCSKYLDMVSCRDEDFEFEESYKSADMERGNAYEPMARKEFERVYDKQVVEIGWAEMKNGIAGISPDGLVLCDQLEYATEAIEIKCPTRKTHSRYIRNNKAIIDDYLWQIVMYFVVFDRLETLYLVSYRPENKIKDLLCIEVSFDMVISIKDGRNSVDRTISELVDIAKTRIIELVDALIKDNQTNNTNKI